MISIARSARDHTAARILYYLMARGVKAINRLLIMAAYKMNKIVAAGLLSDHVNGLDGL